MSLLKLKIMINVAYADCFTLITSCLVEVQSIAMSVSLCRLSVSLYMCLTLGLFFFLICTFFYNLHVSLLKCVDIKPTEQQNLVFSVPLWNLRLLVYYKFTGECALKEFLTPVNIWWSYGWESWLPQHPFSAALWKIKMLTVNCLSAPFAGALWKIKN